MIKNASTIHAHRHLSRIKSTHTNLSLPPCALLDHCPRHRAADGKTLENSSDGVTQTKGDQLLHQKKHTFYLQTINLTNSLLLAFNWNQVFSCVKLYLFIYWLMYLLCVFLCSFVFLLFYSAYVMSSFIMFLPLFEQALPATLPVLLLSHPLLICVLFCVSLFTTLFALSAKHFVYFCSLLLLLWLLLLLLFKHTDAAVR